MILRTWLQLAFVTSVVIVLGHYALERRGVASQISATPIEAEAAYWLQAHGRVTGPEGRQVREVVLFNDYGCSFCAAWWSDYEALAESGTLMRVRILQLTSPEAPDGAFRAALAAGCAADQGVFREYHRRLYGLPSWSPAMLADLARDVSMADIDLFKQCVKEERHREAIAEEVRGAWEIGVAGTPAVVFDDLLMMGIRPDELVTFSRGSLK